MQKYEYIKWYVKEFHGKNAPVILYEVDTENDRYATRMAKIFDDRRIEQVIEEGFQFITEAPVPTVEDINADYPDFYAEKITKEEFEFIYTSKYYNGNIEIPENLNT